MKKRGLKVIMLLLLMTILGNSDIYGQDTLTSINEPKAYLEGLTKTTEEDLSDQQIMLDGESIPIYDASDKRVRGMQLMEFLMSGDYIPDFYVDENKVIKVAILRATTAEEKKMMQMMQFQMGSESELMGKSAPSFVVKDITGNEYSLESLKGKVVILNFWFVECKPCVMEMPELNKLVEEYEAKGVVFLGLASSSQSKIDKFLEKKKFEYKIIPNSEKVAEDYKVMAYPTHVILNKDAQVVYSTSGLGPTTINDIKNTIDLLVKD